MRGRPRLISIGLAALAGAVACGGASGGPGAPAESATPPSASTAALSSRDQGESPTAPLPPGLGEDEKRDITVFRRAAASVVFITNFATQVDVFSFDQVESPQGSGSGFVWDREGHIVTNYHVIESGDRFSVTLADQNEYPAKVIGVAPDKDLAVLQIDAPADRLIPLTLGRSSDLVIGQRVLAVGNPFGFDHTLTTGVVSGLGRELTSPSGRRIRDVIQTDAAINPGNSGGPLLDSSGRLIGINSAIYSPSGASAGIGFAVPVDTVTRLIPQLIKYGRLRQPMVAGVSFISDYYAGRLGYDGVALRDVDPGSPAEEAGLAGIEVTRSRRVRLGDVITGVDGKPVHNSQDMLDAFESAGVGATVRLTVRHGRGGDPRELRIKLK
jgi:S1-C subfamily serine protease